jgi:outer membrane receptor for monomeric catechols
MAPKAPSACRPASPPQASPAPRPASLPRAAARAAIPAIPATRFSINQTDLKGTFRHRLHRAQLRFRRMQSRAKPIDVRSGNSQRNADGTTVTIPNYTVTDPNLNTSNVYKGPVNFIVSAKNHSTVENYAVYLFDTMKFSNHFELNGGVRWERNIGEFTTNTLDRRRGDAGPDHRRDRRWATATACSPTASAGSTSRSRRSASTSPTAIPRRRRRARSTAAARPRPAT